MSGNTKPEIVAPTKLIVRVLQDVVARQTFETYSDLKEVLKCRCACLRIHYDSGLISDAMQRLELGGKAPLIPTRLPRRHVEREPEPVILNRRAATRFLDELRARTGVTPALKAMPAVRRLSEDEIIRRWKRLRRRQFQADQTEAFNRVMQEIAETSDRAAALEAEVVE